MFVSVMKELSSLCQESMQMMVSELDLLYRMLVLLLLLLVMEAVAVVMMLGLLMLLLRLIGKAAEHNTTSGRTSVGIFHPYSGAGGGGERVLWGAIKALQQRYPHVDCVVYTGDSNFSQEELCQHVLDRFSISLLRPVKLVHLTLRPLLEAKYYPRFTLMLQAFGSLFVGFEAIAKYRPDVFIDTMGYSFVFPLVKLMTGGAVNIACYIHYPIISTDMLAVVDEGQEAHNNAGFIARSGILSAMKSFYYSKFAAVYGFVGRQANAIMVNSSWTKGHIDNLWNLSDEGSSSSSSLVFPACNIEQFAELSIIPYEEKLVKKIVSLGQFRPEKDHSLQLRSFKRLLDLVSERGGDIDAIEVTLVIIGGARGPEDHARVQLLQDLAKELTIENQVEFLVNLPFENLKEQLQESAIGLHTMWNEHFGICIAEMQAAGLICVAHNSGGPMMDIVVPHEGKATGLLASDVDTYAEALYDALTMADTDRTEMQESARVSAMRFTDDKFEQHFCDCLDVVMPPTVVADQ